jgi:hypothetical protein
MTTKRYGEHRRPVIRLTPDAVREIYLAIPRGISLTQAEHIVRTAIEAGYTGDITILSAHQKTL